MNPWWLNPLRVLDYTVLGAAIGLLIRGLIRKVQLTIVSPTETGRRTFALAAFIHVCFLMLAFGGVASLTERFVADQPFTWRDWYLALTWVMVIVATLWTHRAEDDWNPDARHE